MERNKINKKEKKEKVGSYFLKPSSVEFFPSGCQLLDLELGGGWALGRISNIVGDNSSGKTLLAIEACANFLIKFPKGKVWFHETEAAFDLKYAEALGMPIDKITFVRDEFKKANVVEGWFNYLKEVVIPFCVKQKTKQPALYIVDTQDALGCEAENKRDVEDGTYNQEKNQVLNRLYRELTEPLETSNVHLMIISQTRQNIGAKFGRKWRVTGEGALKFFASQRIQLAEIGKESKTVKGVSNPYYINVKANCFKNKVGLPYRTCEFPLYFGYGIADYEASLIWLKSVTGGLVGLNIGEGYTYTDIQELALDQLISFVKQSIPEIDNPAGKTRTDLRELIYEKFELKPRGRKKTPGGIKEVATMLMDVGDAELEKKIRERVKKLWLEIETSFLPKRSKYRN